MDDRELIDRATARQPGAFDQLYFAHVDRVHRQLGRIVGPDPDLDDLVQLTFVQAFERLPGFRGDAAFGTWLHRIAVNVALSHLRKRSRWQRPFAATEPAALPQADPAERPDASLERRRRLELLYEALGRLKPKKRIVFVLFEIEGHTLEEIAELVEAPKFTVATRLRSARHEMRKALLRHPGFEQVAVA